MALKLSPQGIKRDDYMFAKKMHERPCVNRPTIGFEWEIPLNVTYMIENKYIQYPDDVEDRSEFYKDPSQESVFSLNEDRLYRCGFTSHFECGGYEVASPIFSNISQARSAAKSLINEAHSNPWLEPDYEHRQDKEYIYCGIHVHAGIPQKHKYTLYRLAYLILNRESAKDFVAKLSGRRSGVDYSRQGRSTCWENRNGQYNGMVRSNFGGDTIEYRMFQGEEHRLLPAIDFSHSFTRWLQTLPTKVLDVTENGTRTNCEGLFFDFSHIDEMMEVIPHVAEYKEWLMKQPGYVNLKSDPSLALI